MKRIGIDIGTSSICAVRLDALSGESTVATKPNTAAIEGPHPGSFQQDPGIILGIVEGILEELLTPDTEAIGFSGQMHGMLYVDSEGRALGPLYTWQDGSGDLPYKDGRSYAGYLSEMTGYSVSTGYGLATHFYNLVNGLVPPSASHLCTIMDYVAMALCKRKVPLCEPSNAASLGFFDKRKLSFDTKALSLAGIDGGILPGICTYRTVVGKYRGVPVYAAIGDNQASFLGSVDDPLSSILVTIGTSSQISVYAPEYIEVPSLDTRPLPGGGYILVGAALCGGCSLAMLKDFFGNTLESFTGERPSDEKIYSIMFGSSAPVGDIPKVDTTFEGTRLDPSRRGTISGITLRNFTPASLVEGFLEGVCNELYDFYKAIPASLREGRTILMGSGNALRRNARLREVLSRTFSLEVSLTPSAEEAAKGAIKGRTEKV